MHVDTAPDIVWENKGLLEQLVTSLNRTIKVTAEVVRPCEYRDEIQ